MIQDLSEPLAIPIDCEQPQKPKTYEASIVKRRCEFRPVEGGKVYPELNYICERVNIGSTFIEVASRFLDDAPASSEPRFTSLGAREFIECSDEYFVYDLLAYGFRKNLTLAIYDARRIIDMIADGDYQTRNDISSKLRTFDIVCIANLHLVSVNVYREALSKVIQELVNDKSTLIFHGKSLNLSLEKFKDVAIGAMIKDLKSITLKQSDLANVLTFDGLLAKQNVSLEKTQYCFPMLFSRIGLFSAIDSTERKRLTEIREPDRWNPTRREIDIPIVRDFTFGGMYVQISGPVVDVDTDMKSFTFLLSEFLRTPNGQGLIKTSWKKIARGFDYERDQSKVGGSEVKAKQRSVQRIADVSIKIFDAKSKNLLYKGGFIDRIAQEGKGRNAYLSIKLSQDIAKELLRCNAIDVGLLCLPQVDFVVYNYLRSHKTIYDMRLDTWVLVLGRNYRGYKLNMTMLRRSLAKAFANLEQRKLVSPGWQVTDDYVRNVKLLAL